MRQRWRGQVSRRRKPRLGSIRGLQRVNRLASSNEDTFAVDRDREFRSQIDFPGSAPVREVMGLYYSRLQNHEDLVASDDWRGRRVCSNWNAPSSRRWQHLHRGAGRRDELRDQEKNSGAKGRHVL